MSIIIKGVNSPKGCGKCHFCDRVWTSPKCHAKSRQGRNIHRKYNMDDYKPDWCPVDEYPVKQGQWIKKRYWSEGVGMGESHGYWYACSVCGHETQGGYSSCDDKFCSQCGAKMEDKR